MVASGELKAPIVIGRDQLDSGSVAMSQSARTEGNEGRLGRGVVSDWPLLNALLNCASGANMGVVPPRRRRRHRLLAAPPAWSWLSVMARRKRRAGLNACCGTTPLPVSCATPTRDTKTPLRAPSEHKLKLPGLK